MCPIVSSLEKRPCKFPYLVRSVLGSLRKAQTIGQDGLRVGLSRLRRSLASDINWLREDLIALRDPVFQCLFSEVEDCFASADSEEI